MSDPSSELIKWIPAASAVAAWIAAVFAFLTARRSGRALRLAELQEARRRPILVPYLHRGYVRKSDADRVYTFLLSLSNPSDSNNTVARMDLRIEYRSVTNIRAAVDIPCVSDVMMGPEGDNNVCLRVPIRLDAHDTIVGCVRFRAKEALFDQCRLDSYTIIATDSHGEQASIETVLVGDLVDETEMQKD